MKKLVVISAVLISLLAVSTIAQMIRIPKEVEEIINRTWKEVGIDVPREQVMRKIMERMRAGELRMNITPYLRAIPVFPPIRSACPPFMVLALPYKAYWARVQGYVRSHLHTKNLTLPELCADKATLESFVWEAIDEINLTWVCAGLQRAAEQCQELRPLTCEPIARAVETCTEGLRRCKLVEERVEIPREVWRERWEALKEEWKAEREALRELWEDSPLEIEIEVKDGYVEIEVEDEVELELTVPSTVARHIIEAIIARTGLAREVVEAAIKLKEREELPEVEPPRIEGIIAKCHKEEKFCEHLEEKLERCREFRIACAPNCDAIQSLANECVAAMADKETLVEKVVDFIWKRCELIDYIPPDVEEVEEEVIPPAEVQPVIVITEPNLTAPQEAAMEAIVERIKRIFTDDVWAYRAMVVANRIEDLRELEFVKFVKLDHVVRAVHKGVFKEIPELPEFAPPTAKILPYLEGVKVKVEVELEPIITEAQVNILNHSKEITEHHRKERGRGIFYQILKFLGLQAGRERDDAAFLEERARAVSEVAQRLREVAQTEKDVGIRALVLEQVSKLQESIDKLTARAAEKRRWAFGIWGWLGLR